MSELLLGAIVVLGCAVAASAVAWFVVAVADALGLCWSESAEARRHAGEAPTFHAAARGARSWR